MLMNTPSLVPVSSRAGTKDLVLQQDIEEGTDFRTANRNEATPEQKKEPFPNKYTPPAEPAFTKEKASPLRNNIIDLPYITRHINRLEYSEKKVLQMQVPGKNAISNVINPQTTPSLLKGVSDRQAAQPEDPFTDATEKKWNKKQKKVRDVFEPDNTLHEGSPTQKKQLIMPLIKQEHLKHSDPVTKNAPVTRLLPAQPAEPMTARNSKTAPKLVIGKITVEVIQPNKPSPAQIINNVKQTPPASDNTGSNQLRFGLGQL